MNPEYKKLSSRLFLVDREASQLARQMALDLKACEDTCFNEVRARKEWQQRAHVAEASSKQLQEELAQTSHELEELTSRYGELKEDWQKYKRIAETYDHG